MTTPIKVVYTWIGPNGPIPNTELPNILNFAQVAEKVSVNSGKFWTDDLYWRIFLNNPDYILSSTFGLTDQDVLIFPYSLTWRIDFHTYFFPNSGILEYSHMPNHILDFMKTFKGYIILECGPEAWVSSEQLKAIHNYFNQASIPLNKIIYLTGCMNTKVIYDNWCNENNIENNNHSRINLIPYPLASYHMTMVINQETHIEPNYNVETIPEKLFLCWNRRFRPHRSILAIALHKLGLVDRSYYSMGKVDPEFQSTEFEKTRYLDFSNENNEYKFYLIYCASMN